jgi:hypothetical protein
MVKIILMTIDEVIGIKMDLLSSIIRISPGNFPIQVMRAGA